jgi:GNAT superfamily N-acetyltransferase
VTAVRRAAAEDAAGIAAVQRAAWMASYSGFIDPSRIAERGAQQTEEAWRVRLSGDRAVTWVAADVAGVVVGFCSAGYAEEDDVPGAANLLALYVEPETWSRGVGRALHDTALEWMRSEGYREAVLWVMAGNGRARDFYRKAGWVAEPATLIDDPDFWNAPTLRYRRSL